MGSRAGLDRCGKSRPPPGFDPRTVQPVASRYTTTLHGPHLLGKKVKQSHYRPGQETETPRFQENRHMKVVRLSALGTGRLYTHAIYLVLISVTG